MGRAEMTTQSSLRTLRKGWRWAANRVRADIGSPWLPAVNSSSFAAGTFSTSARGMTTPSGTLRKPSSRAVLKFCCRLRPTIATLRSNCAATRTRCCIRWMLEAKFATTIRPGASLKIFSKAPCKSLRARASLPLRVRRVAEEQEHTGVAQAAEPLEIGGVAVRRRRIELEVAGVDDPTDGRLD